MTQITRATNLFYELCLFTSWRSSAWVARDQSSFVHLIQSGQRGYKPLKAEVILQSNDLVSGPLVVMLSSLS